MARKFLIIDGTFRFGNVDYHKDLLPKKGNSQSLMSHVLSPVKQVDPIISGGGRWSVDNGKKILYLWGSSMDFGYAKPEDIKKAIESEDTWISQSLNGFEVMHSPMHSDGLPPADTFTLLTTLIIE